MTTTRPAPAWAADPESLALRETARKFFATSAVPNRARWAEQRFIDREFWREAGALGLLCLAIPAEYGGGGGTFAHEMVVLEEQGRIDEPGFGNHVHSGIVAPYLLAYGTEQQKRAWLPKMATGEVVAAIAMTSRCSPSSTSSSNSPNAPPSPGWPGCSSTIV